MAAHAAFCLVTAALLQSFTSLGFGEEVKILAEFTTSHLTERIWNAREESPVCVLYKDSRWETSILENSFQSFLASSLENEGCFFKEWNFGTIDVSKEFVHAHIHPGTIPSLLCYIGSSSPMKYASDMPHTSSKSFTRWLKKVRRSFTTRIKPFSWDNLEAVITTHDGLTVIGIPGRLHHKDQEGVFQKLSKEYKGKIQFLITLPFSNDERHARGMFDVSKYPAVVVFEQQVWLETNKPSYKLQGLHNGGIERLHVLFTVLQSQASLLTVADFPEQVLETKHQQEPIAVCFYSPRNPETFTYLDAFQRSVDTFSQVKANLRFGLVNIVDQPTVVSRYVNASAVTAVPFTVLFWQEKKLGTQQFETKQEIFDSATPTPLRIYQFLQTRVVSVVEALGDQADVYTPWAESDDCKGHHQ